MGGLTLLELMLGVMIIGVLAGLSVSTYGSYRTRTNTQQGITDIALIQAQISTWAIDNNRLPDALADVSPQLAAMRDPWGNPYQYLSHADARGRGRFRKDKNIVPINSDYDLYSMGPDGRSVAPLTARQSRDDIVRANNGRFIGLASDYDP